MKVYGFKVWGGSYEDTWEIIYPTLWKNKSDCINYALGMGFVQGKEDSFYKDNFFDIQQYDESDTAYGHIQEFTVY